MLRKIVSGILFWSSMLVIGLIAVPMVIVLGTFWTIDELWNKNKK